MSVYLDRIKAEANQHLESVIEKTKNMSNEDLLSVVLEQAGGDGYGNGEFSEKALLEYEYLEKKLRARLDEWLSSNLPLSILAMEPFDYPQ